MTTITTVLAFLVTLSILIVIHEYGHYRVAVACGVKVLRFSVGFGRVLWRHQRTPTSTEFVISALPFGGYVRMLGQGEGVVSPDQRPFAFDAKPLWQRAAIVSAGPIANLLLAVLLYSAQHWVGSQEPRARIGTPTAQSLAEQAGLRAGDWVKAVSTDGNEWHDVRSATDLHWQLTQSVLEGERLHLAVTDGDGRSRRTAVLELDRLPSREMDAATLQRVGLGAPFIEPVAAAVTPAGPAARAGLRVGDRVLSVDGQVVSDAAVLREAIRLSAPATSPARAMQWRVDRSGQTLTLALTAQLDDDGRGGKAARVGMAFPAPETVTVAYGPWEGVSRAVEKTWDMSVLTVRMLGRMLIGQASLKNISGPLTIADYAGQSVRLGLAYYLGFLAVVSVSLGVLNLLPLPVLDGGHLMYYLFEAVTGRPPSDAWLERLQIGGMAVIFMMMSLALYNDLARYLLR